MKPFLKEAAEDIIFKYGKDINKSLFIFPNKRTYYFFRKYYSETINKVGWSPDMRTLKQIVSEITKINEPDKLALIYELYETIKSHKLLPDDSYPKFADFYRIGEVILNDFNEIDSWLIDADALFKNIKDIAEIDNVFAKFSEEQIEIIKQFWRNFKTENQSVEKNKFIKLWNALPKIYNKFSEKILKNNTAYRGLIYKEMTKKLKESDLYFKRYKRFFIIGFNALNKTEEIFFKHLINNFTAESYWNTDKYYQSDKKQEAGFFIRKNFRNLEISNDKIYDNLKSGKKNIHVISAMLSVGQAKLLPVLLKTIPENELENNTAIVIPDESLLLPVLHSLPENIKSLNITMGFPFKSTTIYSLIIGYLNLHKNNISADSYSYNDVLKILQHPQIKDYNSEIAENTVNELKQKNIPFVKWDFVANKDNALFPILFMPLPNDNPEQMIVENLLNILYILFIKEQRKNESAPSIEKEFIYKSYKKIKRFGELISEKNIKAGIRLTIKLLKQILSSEKIPFEGEAVEGLQIMGVLEARNLDFKNIIIMGLNEGIFPSVSAKPTFISENMRYVFDLPAIKYQDSVFAYMFYSLIQRAENIKLVYNNIVNNNTPGEISRFILQLKNESDIKIEEFSTGKQLKISKNNEINILKNQDIYNQLYRFTSDGKKSEKKLSISAVDMYITCSLKFYFRYIAEIHEPAQVEETITQRTFGIILHNAVEIIYQELANKKGSKSVEKDDFDFLKEIVSEKIDSVLKAIYPQTQVEYFKKGKHLVIHEVLQEYILNILKVDRKRTPFEIVSNEGYYKSDIIIETPDGEKIAELGGYIDRLDFKDDTYFVIDYKTGKAIKEFKGVDDLFSDSYNRPSAVLQTFFYTYLVSENRNFTDKNIEPYIYDLRGMSSKNFNPKIILNENRKKNELNPNIIKRLLPEFIQNMKNVIEEIFNEELSFTQTTNSNSCIYCNYKEICNM